MKASTHRVLAGMLLSVLVISGQLAGQETTRAKKVLTPEQQKPQEKFKSYLARRHALQKQAARAFDAETVRGKAGDCKSASNTRDIEICLEKESVVTGKNYSTFAATIRELLSLKYPQSDQSATSGPTGTALDAESLTREFDSLQTAWEQYRKIVTTTAYDQYKGGTIAPVVSAKVDQELVRSHMRELNFIYEGLLRR